MELKVISKNEIEEILKKYNIGKKPLSLVLGWGEITIIRYLDGGIPDKLHSDVLYSIKNDPYKLLEYLENNKSLITDLAYKKVKARIEELENEEDEKQLYLIAKHIIATLEDTTPLALQKILYYIEGFSLALLNKSLFLSSPEAWVHGPVYKEIYEKYNSYKFNSINRSDLKKYVTINQIDSDTMDVIDEVIKCFGCYSGKTLEKMTHLSDSWITARGTLDKDELSNEVIDKKNIKKEFLNICQKYHINDYADISRYSNKLFKRIFK